MPTNRRRRTRGQGGLLDWAKIQELETGDWCLLAATGYQYPDYGANPAPGLPAMERDWAKHGAQITSNWIERHPGTRPWSWWEFSAPEPKAKDETQAEYLARLDLLTPKETEQ